MAAKKTKSKSLKKGGGKATKAKKSKPAKKSAAKSKSSKKPVKKKVLKAKKAIKPKKIVAKKVVVKPAKKVIVKAVKPEKIQKKEEVVVVKKERKNAKQPLYVPPPLPVIEISNHPKTRVKNILVSQPKPDNDKNPYIELARKHSLFMHFRQFIKVEGVSAIDFRTQRVDILQHQAVILTSKQSVDHYFRVCNEMRITVPETMKYFCINEQTAYYLQKYIQYRKRKIFFGHGTIIDLVDVIRKNREEKFLLPVSDVHKEQIVDFLDELQIQYTKAVIYKTVSADLSDIKNLNDYDVLVFFTPAGIKSLKNNFPNFKQGNTRIAAFGHATAQCVKQLGYRLDVFAPNPQNPSMSGALDAYIKEANKR
ncbi:MAG: uroporphyrinogen-III synthase [Sphingobacteriaceae bacterium]|nr:uroporphyrinogen-III synthase [Sphingobacteriaceae bacterium]